MTSAPILRASVKDALLICRRGRSHHVAMLGEANAALEKGILGVNSRRTMASTIVRPVDQQLSRLPFAHRLGHGSPLSRQVPAIAHHPIYCRNFSIASPSRPMKQKQDINQKPGGTEAATTGLFSIPGLLRPQNFLKMADEAVKTSNGLRESIATMLQHLNHQPVTTKSQAIEILYTLDQISKTICNVIDAAELCRSAHASQEWRDAAQRTFSILQEYISTLNADQNLYWSLRAVTDATSILQTLSPEEQRFAMLLQTEFELDGIHLPDQEREYARQLHGHVTNLETLFANNITNSSGNEFQVSAALIEPMIPKHVLMENGAVYDADQSQVQLTTESPLAHSITTFANHGELRKQVYLERMTSCPENLDVLDALIKMRHESATVLGFTSYADRFLKDKMAQSPANVLQFLSQLQQHIQPRYQQEMQVLRHAKQHIEGGGGGTDNAAAVTIEPWDIKFYTTFLKNQPSSGGVDPSELAPYFCLANCLNAMQYLVQRLFGIQMTEESMSDAERWDYSSDGTASFPPKDEQIRKFVFVEEATGRGLGTMYLDLHPRQGKYTHAAHFTVRGGCVVDGPDSEYQLPIVALVCNMNTGSASFSSHQEVETLFHEFGHAMHSLLSRTNFQHVSGTRAAMDFVETPSHWMEHYVWDAQFLPFLAIHARTGEPIPEQYIQSLRNSRDQFRCIELQSQIVLAMFDQQIFGIQRQDGKATTMDIWAELHRQSGVPHANGTHWYTNVGHLVTYGAGYYGYLYSQVFASDIWNQLFQGKSLKRESGELMWKKLLMHGGARDANLILRDVLGREPAVGHFLEGLS